MADLTEGVRSAHANPEYMKSKGEIWDYYLDKNNGDRTKAASEAARTLSGESSGKAYRNARRNFEGDRGKQEGTTSKWLGFGKQLDPSSYTPKENSITVTIRGTQTGGSYKRNAAGQHVFRSGGTREREFTTTFTGPDAYQFVNNPSLRTFFKNMGYPDDVIEQIGDGGDYGVTVTSVS